MIIDRRTIKVAHKFNLQPIRGLDKNRPYVLLCEDGLGRKLVIKTDHLQDEASILAVLNKTKQNDIIIPKIYRYEEKFIIEDFIPGKEINNFTNSGDINNNGKAVLLGLKALLAFFNKNSQQLSRYTKGWDDRYCKTPFRDGDWLFKRIERWFDSEHSREKYRFESHLKVIKKMPLQIKSKNIISFGAFSPSHIRLVDNKLGIFDFGRHIRWAPEPYDSAYLWWGHLMELKINRAKEDYRWWLRAVESIEKNIKSNRKLFWLCIVERLAGLAKDLTHRESVGHAKWVKVVSKIQKRLAPIVLSNLTKPG